MIKTILINEKMILKEFNNENFSNLIFYKCEFSYCFFKNCDFRNAIFKDCKIENCRMLDCEGVKNIKENPDGVKQLIVENTNLQKRSTINFY